MSFTIKLFMWGFQRHFQISLQHRAEDLFKALNPEFEVETFLLGILREQKADRHPICLEPEDCGFNPSDFASVMKDAEHYQAVDPERDVICSHEAHQQSFTRRIRHRSLHRAVLDQLRGWRSRKQGEYFFSGFMPVAEYDVDRIPTGFHPSAQRLYRRHSGLLRRITRKPILFDPLLGNADLLQHFPDGFHHRFRAGDVEKRFFQVRNKFFDRLFVDALRTEEVMDF